MRSREGMMTVDKRIAPKCEEKREEREREEKREGGRKRKGKGKEE